MALIANCLVLLCVAFSLLADISLAAKATTSLRGWSAVEQSYIPELPWFSILYSWFPGGVSIILQKEVEWIEPNKQNNILSKTSEPRLPLVATPNAAAEEEGNTPNEPSSDGSEEKKKPESDGESDNDKDDDDTTRRRAAAVEGDDDWLKSDDEWMNGDENFFYTDFNVDFYFYDSFYGDEENYTEK